MEFFNTPIRCTVLGADSLEAWLFPHDELHGKQERIAEYATKVDDLGWPERP